MTSEKRQAEHGKRSDTVDTFTLWITFTGMCLLSPDRRESTSANRLHALLLQHGDHEHGAEQSRPPSSDKRAQHLARLVYDEAYGADDRTTLSNALQCEPLTHCALQLEGPGFTDPLDLTLPDAVADLRTIAGVDRLARAYVTPGSDDRPTPPEIAARITIGAGRLSTWVPSGEWTCDPNQVGWGICNWARLRGVWPRLITHRVEWVIADVPTVDGTWTLNLLGLNSGSRIMKAFRLHPIDGSIVLHIYNNPVEDLPPADPPDRAERAHPSPHFEGYYSVARNGNGVIPVLAKDAPPVRDPLPYPSKCKTRRLTSRPNEGPLTGSSSTCVMVRLDAAEQ